ncbi:hypothetical protein [Saliterribacillus persicus]|uniref:Lipoprotein n=1 Tax=Saliterribacillus persicus TaxID=930114 RepID=A0A368Y045_9BACI|nr:hypothetical protein [Saliterribacillus persicus]RCW73069.1 hypothetical protein DFR57_10464 [Saliterribacillus persicus]
MRVFISIFLLFLFSSILIGCVTSPGQNEGGVLNKEQVLKLNPDADLFEFNGKVYSTGVNWIEEKELTKGEQVGEISEGMANKLPLGAKIFETNESGVILIVEYDGRQKRYLLQSGE